MKMKSGILLASALLILSLGVFAQTTSWQLVPPSQVPETATFWILSWTNSAPIPYNPWPGCNVYSLGSNQFAVDDLEVAAAIALLAESQTMEEGDPLPPDGGEGDTNGTWNFEFSSPVYGSNDLWLELTAVDRTNYTAVPRLHGTVENDTYQLLSHTNLAQPTKDWIPGEIVPGATGTNVTDFLTVSVAAPPITFYRAHHANPIISVFSIQDAFEPYPPSDPGRIGILDVYGENLTTDITVYYTVSGSATPVLDYTNLSGVLVVPAGGGIAEIDVQPLYDGTNEPDETVTITLKQGTNYLVRPDQVAATVAIKDFSTTVDIETGLDAIEPDLPTSTPGRTGFFWVDRVDERGFLPPLAVEYQISGTASNGVDYTNITGTLIFDENETTKQLYIEPIPDSILEPDEIVTLTLQPGHYNIDTNRSSASILLLQANVTNFFSLVASNFSVPIGIDYSTVSNCLIVSTESGYNGQSYNLYQIYTNIVLSNSVAITNVVVTNWSRIAGLQDEVKLASIKANAGGFTNGDLYFGSGAGIGWLSASGSVSNRNWCVLTNQVVTNALPLRGGICADTTGVFSNRLVALGSEGISSFGPKGIWLVDAQAHPTLLTNIATFHLEGVITLPNDAQKWGPWAGKIITGDEDRPPPVIYAISTNGAFDTYDTTALIPGGIHPEDFDIIPPNQDLYCCDPGGYIVKVPSRYLTNYVGDLLITDAGEIGGIPAVFVLHWDSALTNFVARRFRYSGPEGSKGLEHVGFAPIDIPSAQ